MELGDVKQAARLVELRATIKDVQAAFGADPTTAPATISVLGAPIVGPGGTQSGIRATMELEGARMNRFAAFLTDLLTNVEARLVQVGVVLP